MIARTAQIAAGLAALTLALHACGSIDATSNEDGGAPDGASTSSADSHDEPAVDATPDPCSTTPRGDTPEARSRDALVGCKSTGAPRTVDQCPACQAGGSWLELAGDGVARRWESGYRAGCSGPTTTQPTCVPDRLEACDSTDTTRSCVWLRNSFQGSPQTTPDGHYLDRQGRCWTLYDARIDANHGQEGEPSDGTFRATAERCGARLELSGTFHACLAYKWTGTCK